MQYEQSGLPELCQMREDLPHQQRRNIEPYIQDCHGHALPVQQSLQKSFNRGFVQLNTRRVLNSSTCVYFVCTLADPGVAKNPIYEQRKSLCEGKSFADLICSTFCVAFQGD